MTCTLEHLPYRKGFCHKKRDADAILAHCTLRFHYDPTLNKPKNDPRPKWDVSVCMLILSVREFSGFQSREQEQMLKMSTWH